MPITEPEVTAAIDRLSKLNEVKYQLERRAEADRLGLPLAFIDKQVDARQRGAQTEKQGRQLVLPEPEPWPDPVDGEEVLTEAAAAIRSYVVASDHGVDIVALWCAHTFLIDAFGITPRLGITSPEKGCGKTTLLDVVRCLVLRPLATANATTAAVFRIVDKSAPTLLIDEADTFLGDNQELRGILNSGHRRSTGYVMRIVGDEHEPQRFATFAPCAIALIGKLPDTLQDRSVPVELKRRLAGETINRFRADRTEHLDTIGRKLARWAKDNLDKVREADPAVPAGITNRAEDNWRVLLAIADVAGGSWPERARQACKGTQSVQADDSTKIALLADIRGILAETGADEIKSEDLVDHLASDSTKRWCEYVRGKRITPKQLASLLKPFNIFPVTVHPPNIGHGKGYRRLSFEDAFKRYLSAT